MRTPLRSLPPTVERWISRARWLRWLDALVAWLVVWLFLALWLEHATPVSALVSLSVSRRLRPGDRAWLVLSEHIEPVIVTARRRLRLVVARPDQGPTEGLEVRRTRVVIVPPAR